MRPPSLLLVATVSWCVVGGGCAVLSWPTRQPRSGTLLASDGTPIANADVEVSTWRRVAMRGRTGEAPIHKLSTRTDEQGHFAVRGGTTLQFVILGVPEGPAYETVYEFRAAHAPDLVVSEHQLNEITDAHMRVALDDDRPLSGYPVPALGFTFGGTQRFSGHVGAAFLVGRHHLAMGPRADVELGDRGVGGAVGVALVLCCRSTLPFPAVELNARYFRPWAVDDRRAPEFGPELAIDLASLRFTLAGLGASATAPIGDRRFVFGVGFGYF